MPPLVFFSDPADVRTILTAPPTVLHPGAGGATVAPLFGEDSFILHDEDAHIEGRRMLLPAFTSKTVREHAAIVADIIERDIARWPHDTALAVHPYLRSLTLKVIIREIFGEPCHIHDTLHRLMLEMLSVMASPILQEPRLRHLPGWHGTWRRLLRQRTEVDKLIYELMYRRRSDSSRKGDLLDILLRAHSPRGDSMSSKQICDNLVSVLIAGHETTAAELAWAFQLLAHNQDVQNKLIADLDRDSEAYLKATVREVLRHRPVFLFPAPRAVVRPIEVSGTVYRPPVQLLACIYLVHHDTKLFSNPNEFRPERFLDTTPNPRTWLPWGGGPKHCPGRHLALLEMQTVLRVALSTHTIVPVSKNIERASWRSVIVTPHAGARIALRKRPNALLH
jgi:hypothetical protein